MRAAPPKNIDAANVVKAPVANVGQLQQFVERHPNLFVITGAGVSNASGIPTYRDEVGNWMTNTPIQHGEFLELPGVRQRYWARSFVGWPNVGNASPNRAHRSLAEIEALGLVSTLVTQNIDRLHQKAGHKRVIDLHGRLDQVICMDCGNLTSRDAIQQWLWQHNPHMEDIKVGLAPDGDAHVADELIREIKVPSCSRCDGLLKPNVVFYGGSVGKEVVNYLYSKLLEADAVLVVGTSMMVYSSFRFCRLAAEKGIPIAAINRGLTRADGLLQLKVSQDCGDALTSLATGLSK